MPSRLTELQRAQEKLRILSANYPYYPYLPVKRYVDKGSPELGTIKYPQVNIVYLTGLLHLSSTADVEQKCKKLEYTDIDTLLNDGWMGD